MENSMLRKVLFGLVAMVIACLIVSDMEAGYKSVSRQSSRTQATSGSTGHYVTIPVGVFEGVGTATTRREAIRIACNNGGRTLSKSVTRDANGMFHSSVIRSNR